MLARKSLVVALAGIGCLVASGLVSADTLVVQNGQIVGGVPYSGTECAWLHSTASGGNARVGYNGMIRAGTQSDGTNARTLVRFNSLSHWAGIDVGFGADNIIAAKLTLYKKGGEGTGTVEMSVLNETDQDWTEMYCTWNKKRYLYPSLPDLDWVGGPGVGTNHGPTLVSNAFDAGVPTYTPMEFALTGAALDVVKGWVSGSNTSGTLFVRASDETGTAMKYYDWYAEETSVGDQYKPKLEITYSFEQPPVNVTGTVIPGDYVGDPRTVGVQVDLRQGGTTVRTEYRLLDSAGQFAIDNVTAGTYDVAVKGACWLSKVLTAAVGAGNTDLGTFELVAGDIDGDNEVTTSDLATVLLNMDQMGDE